MALVQDISGLAVPETHISFIRCDPCYTLSRRRALGSTTKSVPLSLSVWSQFATVSNRRHVAPLSGRKVFLEKLWRDFFSDPSNWWDHRAEKVNPRYPDFKHKRTRNALWIVEDSNPPWVEANLVTMAPGRLQLTIFSWNVRLRRTLKAGDYKQTIELFHQLQQECMEPDKFTFVPMLNACARLGVLEEGRRIHAVVIRNGYELDLYVASCLVDMYVKCGSIGEAWIVFLKMPSRDVISWNVMIQGYVKCGAGQKAMELFRQMHAEGVEPNNTTFVGVLNACASVSALEEGRLAHEEIIRRGYESHLKVASSLVDMYAKCGSIEYAERVFNEIPVRDLICWNIMLAGYAMHGRANEALEQFEHMCQEDVKVNGVTFVCLLSALSHGALLKEGLYYLKSMRAVYNITPTVEHYTCAVDLLGRTGHLHEAEDLIRSMPCEPNAAAWMSLLGACRIHGNVEMGERVAKRVLELDPENASAYVLLSNIYAGARKWDVSEAVHRERLRRDVKSVLGRTSIEVNGRVHSFVVDDNNHPQIAEIHLELGRLSLQMRGVGYVPITRWMEPEGFDRP